MVQSICASVSRKSESDGAGKFVPSTACRIKMVLEPCRLTLLAIAGKKTSISQYISRLTELSYIAEGTVIPSKPSISVDRTVVMALGVFHLPTLAMHQPLLLIL